jgi:hypothetical protein
MKMSLIGMVIFIGILLLLLPDIQDVPEERMASVAMAMCVADIKIAISADLKKGKKIKTNYENKCPKLISKLSVREDGNIETFNPTYRIQLLFKPILKDGVVKWSCQGKPDAFVPKACRVNKDIQSGQ